MNMRSKNLKSFGRTVSLLAVALVALSAMTVGPSVANNAQAAVECTVANAKFIQNVTLDANINTVSNSSNNPTKVVVPNGDVLVAYKSGTWNAWAGVSNRPSDPWLSQSQARSKGQEHGLAQGRFTSAAAASAAASGFTKVIPTDGTLELFIRDSVLLNSGSVTWGVYSCANLDDGAGQCSDSKDNDDDGFVDKADPDCWDADGTYNPDNDEDTKNDGNSCVDGIDNDGDGKVDRDDDDCHTDGDAEDGDDTFDPTLDEDSKDEDDDDEDDSDVGQCEDGSDNDGDGFEDKADPDCYDEDGNYDGDRDEDTDNSHNSCVDAKDNDGDGMIDSSDPDCHTDGDPNDNDGSFDPTRRENTNNKAKVAGTTTKKVAGTTAIPVPVTAKTGPGALALLATALGGVGLAAGKRLR